MPIFMVERGLKNISAEQLAGAQRSAIEKAGEMRAAGTEVNYIRSMFAPGDGRCFCLFQANTDVDVKRLNDEAGLPYDRVVEALDLTP